MKHEVYYDEEAGVLRLNLKGVFTKDDAPEFFSLVEKLYEGKPHRYVPCDLAEGGAEVPKDKEYRKWLTRMYTESDFEKIAIMNIHPAMRMLVKVLLTAVGKKEHMRFFKTEEGALAWLKG